METVMKYLTASLLALGIAAGPAMANDRIEAACLADLQESPLPPETTFEDLAPACGCIAAEASDAQVADMINVLDRRSDGENAEFPESVDPLFESCFADSEGEG